MRSFLLTGLIGGLLCLGGVSTVYGFHHMRSGESCGCDSPCEDGCGPSCRSAPWYLREQADCGGDCGYPCRWPYARSSGSCDPCEERCCTQTCHDRTYCGPLTPLFALFNRDCWCGKGCGERYYGDFYSDPPDFRDPCDRCGNYTGGWNGCASGGRGCNCDGGYRGAEQMMPSEGRIISQGERVMEPIPTPAPKPQKGVK